LSLLSAYFGVSVFMGLFFFSVITCSSNFRCEAVNLSWNFLENVKELAWFFFSM
jgi:hypothetical protein